MKSGSTVKAKISKVQCAVCKKEAFCFHGDDLDTANLLKLKDPANIFALRTKGRLAPCDKLVLGTGRKLYPHIFGLVSTYDTTSSKIAETLQYFIYSN